MSRVLLILFILSFVPGTAAAQLNRPLQPLKIKTQSGQIYDFKVDTAITAEEQATGLMNRMGIPRDGGMLFMFAKPKDRHFWMKDTYIPLDIIFIRADGVIHHIHHNAHPHDRTRLLSNGPVPAVLEIQGGLSEKLGIKEGDTVHHTFFSNFLEE